MPEWGIRVVGLLAYLAAGAVLVWLGISVYADLKNSKGKHYNRKLAEYLAIGIGGMLLFTLLRTIWATPVDKLSATIQNYTQRVIWRNPLPQIEPVNSPHNLYITSEELEDATKNED